ncbi:hypothetical protein EVG20_g9545, partial [Dentipellis fragilis]
MHNLFSQIKSADDVTLQINLRSTSSSILILEFKLVFASNRSRGLRSTTDMPMLQLVPTICITAMAVSSSTMSRITPNELGRATERGDVELALLLRSPQGGKYMNGRHCVHGGAVAKTETARHFRPGSTHVVSRAKKNLTSVC